LSSSSPGAGRARLSLGAASWSLLEGARDPYVILITIYIFQPYLAGTVVGDAVKGQALISQFAQYAGWAVMATAPFLGAACDRMGRRKVGIAFLTAAMVMLIAGLWFTKPDGSGLSPVQALLMTSTIGVLFSWSEVLHNSLLLRAAGLETAHKASGLALSAGNFLSVVALAFTAWAFALPGLPETANWPFLPHEPLFGLKRSLHEPDRVVTLLCAGNMVLASIPFFLFTPDAPRSGTSLFRALIQGGADLFGMVRTVSQFKDAAVYLTARMFYFDGMGAVLVYAGVYAVGVMKWGSLEMLMYGIILSILAVLGGQVGSWLDHWMGPKNAVRLEVFMAFLGIIAILGMGPEQILFFWHWSLKDHAPLWRGPFFRTLPEWIYLLIGFSNAIFITAQYATSRTLLTRLTPPKQTGAFFGVYALSATATGWLGPMLVNFGTRTFHSQQGGFAMITLLLGAGLLGLAFVKGGTRGKLQPD
jgi:MFS transporter, UMF1 family